MAERDQVKPLAPAGYQLSSDEDDATMLSKKLQRRKYIKCCGCIMALMLIQAVTIIILAFTVFRIKDPVIKMNGVQVEQLELINGTTIPRPGVNMTLTADVSVKNPNVASFKFSNTTTTLYYRGTVVGEARNPPGKAKARRTLRMNITVEIIPDRLMNNPNLKSDVDSKILTMSSYTRIGGRVKIMKIIKKHVIVKMNCTISVNITSQAIQEQKCKRSVKL
ncbi:hypothetical protein HHK36_027630 [Tetracentron sinense]|uniref:Water stress and hypersensitive response domain-containing protein n=1 Tax=Tetracentron sinense TaxID=13715 RepID=A0A834YHU8_TETSI|nr:hypothetical protein HHK36_027630 [Tetracentron sinense]